MQQSVIFCLKETRCSGSTLMALECIKVLPRNTFVNILCRYNQDPSELYSILSDYQVKIIESSSWINYCFKFIRLTRKKNSLIHTHSSVVGYLIRFIGFKYKNKIIHTIHGISFHDHSNFLIKFIGRNLDYYLSKYFTKTNVSVNNFYVETFFHDLNNIEVIPNCSFYRNENENQDKVLVKNAIIFCARLDEQKNPLAFIRIIAEIKDTILKNGFRVCIFGDGSLKDEMLSVIKQNNITDLVEFFGWVDWKSKFYFENCIHVLTSKWEAFGLTIIEMAEFDIPTIAYNTEGIPEVIENNVTGFIIEDFNSNDFIFTIKRLINEKELTLMLGKNAKDIYRDKFNPQKYKDSYKKIYSKFIKQL